MVKKIVLYLLIIFSLSSGTSISAIVAPLEVQYPQIKEGEPYPVTTEVPLPNYVRYIFVFIVVASGIIALAVLISAGFQYLTAAGDTNKVTEARQKIFSALIGIFIILGSFLILNTINPNLTFLYIERLPFLLTVLPEGIYLCDQNVPIIEVFNLQNNTHPTEVTREIYEYNEEQMKKINKFCEKVENKKNLMKMNDKIKYVYMVPGKFYYGVILYEESDFKGKAVIYYYNSINVWQIKSNRFRPSSAIPFFLNFESNYSYVELYEKIKQNQGYPNARTHKIFKTQLSEGVVGAFEINLPVPEGGPLPEIGSLKIEAGPGQKLIVIFFKNQLSSWQNWTDETEIEVYTQSDDNLNNNLMGYWREDCKEKREDLEDRQYPCASFLIVVSGSPF